jgi:hypothetical protein
MVLTFFYCKGIIYTNYIPRGTMVNASYIVEALGKFMKIFRKKRLLMAKGQWFFHWEDNAPVHTTAVDQDWLASERFSSLNIPLFS